MKTKLIILGLLISCAVFGQVFSLDQSDSVKYITYPQVYDLDKLYFQASVSAGADDTITAGQTYQLAGSQQYMDSVVWITSGTGTFDDDNSLTAVYTPSVADQTAGSVNLTLIGSVGGQSTGDVLTLTINPNYEAETLALLARMTNEPVLERQLVIDAYIAGLKDSGIWAKADRLYVMSAHDEQAAKLNWTANTDNLTNMSAVFKADTGFTGNGSSTYLKTGFIPSTDGVNYTQNDAGIWQYVYDNIASNGTDVGVETYVASPYFFCQAYLVSRTTTNVTGGRLNNETASSTVASITNGSGASAIYRYGANSLYGVKDSVFTTQSTQVSNAIPSHEFYILARNRSNTIESGAHSPRTIQVVYIGAALTEAENKAMIKLTEAYLDGVAETLVAQLKGDLLFDMVLAGDVQVEWNQEFVGVRQTVDSIEYYDPTWVSLAGDIGWPGGYNNIPDGAPYYDTIYNIFSGLNDKIIFTAGNHDNDVIESTQDSNWTAFAHYLDLMNPDYLEIDTLYQSEGYTTKGDWTLNYRGVKQLYATATDTFYLITWSHSNNSSASAAAGGANQDIAVNADLVWLESVLDEYNRAGVKLILMEHYPPFAYGWYDPAAEMFNYDNAADMISLIDEYDNIIFVHNAHVHQWYINTTASTKVPYIVSSRFAAGTSQFNNEAAGFYYVKIYENAVEFTAKKVTDHAIGTVPQDSYYLHYY